jgi:signal transduction histidine kinase
MTTSSVCPLATILAQELRGARDELTARWLHRIAARVALEPNRVFPTDELLDHVPLLVDGIADFIEDPADALYGDVPVMAKARELGELRYQQGFDVYEILKEHEILGGVLFTFVTDVVERRDEECSRGELMQCAHRLVRAIEVIRQATTMHFLDLLNRQVYDREQRLRGFNRMVSHELKNRVGAIIGGQAMLVEAWVSGEERERFVRMIGDNARAIQVVLDDLVSLSRLDESTRQQRHVPFASAVREVMRQLRDAAASRGVAIRAEGGLPETEVSAAAVELALMNYVSNAVKYSDPAKPDRWVRIAAGIERNDDRPDELVVRVADNGLGVPTEKRERLFDRFFRAHTGAITGVEGTGLGLSIVRETIEQLGGRTWAEFPASGETVFAFSVPMRREADRAATASRRPAGIAASGTAPAPQPPLERGP